MELLAGEPFGLGVKFIICRFAFAFVENYKPPSLRDGSGGIT
jgi:hypothetical protein